jgi:hypothetical protein
MFYLGEHPVCVRTSYMCLGIASVEHTAHRAEHKININTTLYLTLVGQQAAHGITRARSQLQRSQLLHEGIVEP